MGASTRLQQRYPGSTRTRSVRCAVAFTCVGAVGLYLMVSPTSTAGESFGRLAPVLLFLAAMSIVVNLSGRAGVFEQVASTTARWAHNRALLLWLLVAVLAMITTAFLSLDTTAVLLTPLAVALARTAGNEVMPLALTVVWIANIGSLWLPVSNLTNLLAMQSGAIADTKAFLHVAILPAAVAMLAVTAISYALFHRRLRGPGSPGRSGGTTTRKDASPIRCEPVGIQRAAIADPGPVPAVSRRHPAYRVCALTLMVLLPVLVTPVPYWASTSVAAVVLTAMFLRHDRTALRPGLLPWSALALATVLVLSVQIVHQLGVEDLIRQVLHHERFAPSSLVVLAGAGAGMSNLINNVPAYLLLEPAADTPTALMALLIGTNAGPLITPWASLATLLWAEQLRRSGIRVPWRRFVLLGSIMTPVAVGLPVLVLTLQLG